MGPAIGTLFAIQGIAMDDEKSKETALLSYESFAFGGTDRRGFEIRCRPRSRPSKTDDAFIFQSASGDSSFPSGHTTEAFAAATVFPGAVSELGGDRSFLRGRVGDRFFAVVREPALEQRRRGGGRDPRDRDKPLLTRKVAPALEAL